MKRLLLKKPGALADCHTSAKAVLPVPQPLEHQRQYLADTSTLDLARQERTNHTGFVYTSYDSAELFINGKSMGVQKKHAATPQNRYRLMWMNVQYEPGTVKMVAFGKDGKNVHL